MDYGKFVGVVYSHLYRYARYVEAIDEFRDSAMRQNQKQDQEHIRGSFHSDPTARGGIILAEPPSKIKTMQEWVYVIDTVHEQFRMEDEAYNRGTRGIAYVMRTYFCMDTHERRDKKNNAAMQQTLAKRCRVSQRTIYAWLHTIGESVAVFADKKGLLKGE